MATASASLAQKLGKDKGYLENRLRLADAPGGGPRAGVLAQRHPVPRLRADEGRRPEEAQAARRAGRQGRADARQAARQDRGPAQRARPHRSPIEGDDVDAAARRRRDRRTRPKRRGPGDGTSSGRRAFSDDSLVAAKQQLADAVEGLIDSSGRPDVVGGIAAVDRANLAKYLTIAKLRLENAIAVVRSDGELSQLAPHRLKA